MVGPKRREATYQDVLDAPEHVVAEIVDGELHLWPRPRSPHAVSMSALGGARRLTRWPDSNRHLRAHQILQDAMRSHVV